MISRGKLAQGFILLIIVTLSAILVAAIWRKKVQPVHKETQHTVSSDQEMKLRDMKFTEMQEGKRYWTLHASEARYFQDEQKTLLQNVHLIFYLNKAGQQLQLTSNQGVLYPRTKNIDLKGNIRVKLPHDYVATMQTAHYIHSKKIVESGAPVHLSGPGLVLDGNTWKYDINDHVAEVEGKVIASLVLGELSLGK
ncbi:MAG: LPS export ABC transporter periplasmic protein LptC [Deltaproteobacteria bacterium]|jgi:LPS export ABC transporter protein LptC|nr:LPS export ABC transporter periplasmic protein LptC [Deltaproteobacteria bacterium]MDA8308186.1 LPS export ABC transporter periplasmic protein LptC [Deltaproteobacteria bacterium]